MKFGPAIRSLRKKRGLAQRVLAERAGIQPQYLCGVESGQYEPSRTLVQTISGILEVSEETLFLVAFELPRDAVPSQRKALEALRIATKALEGSGHGGKEERSKSARARKRS